MQFQHFKYLGSQAKTLAYLHLGPPPTPSETGRIVAGNGDTPLMCPSQFLYTSNSEAFSSTPLLLSLFYFPIYISVILFYAPPPLYTHTQQFWVFKEIRRYSSLKTSNHSLEIPDLGVRVFNSEGIWRPRWCPSSLFPRCWFQANLTPTCWVLMWNGHNNTRLANSQERVDLKVLWSVKSWYNSILRL